MKQPKTLQEAIIYFADLDKCQSFIVARHWPNGVVCPTCASKDVRYIATRRVWECKNKHPRKQFSVKVGTIFEDSPIGLDKWLVAMWIIANCKNGVSSYEIGRALGITQKSAWFMLHRIRLAMQNNSFVKMGGKGSEVEVDETFIGGAARFMHRDKHHRRITSTGSKDKVPVLGMLERDGELRVTVVPTRRKKVVQEEILGNVEQGTQVYTDSLLSYWGLEHKGFVHKFIDHAEKYVDGRVHTNGMENFWSLLKRGLKGTYISVEPFHLFRYIDEQVFRYNNRKKPMDDFARFQHVASHVIGKRLTYAAVTGKVGATDFLPN
jgi:hypothetical protein